MIFTCVTFVFFTILVAVISYVKTKGDDQTTADGYFLAGRGLPGIVIAGSLLLTNLSAEQLVGTNGQTWAIGMSPMAFEVMAATALIVLALGLITSLRTPQNTKIYARDGLAIVALVWVLMSVFGALPFVISGEIPSFADAFFETVSGFTTTGSTILTDVEALSHGTLFWRSFSHWIGGMGVLVFAMAVLPMTDGRAMHLMRAEVPGPTCGKISSKLSDSAKILYAIYLVMTVIETILLCAGGMPLFDALIHAFGTAGTGGFSNKALSVGAYNSPYFEIVIGVFMLLFGINFNLYYFLLLRHFREAFASEEMHVYLGIVAFSTLTITANIASMYDSVGTALSTIFCEVLRKKGWIKEGDLKL